MTLDQHMYRFEKLRVYNDALDLVEIIYLLLKKLPKEEMYVLVPQLKRSAISIVLNIAEGSGALGDKEYKSFLRIAVKSVYETIAGLKITERLYNLDIEFALNKSDIVAKELHALINSLTRD